MRPSLSADIRLNALTDVCPVCDTIADVGTDHGKAALMLILKKKCRHVIATDISAESLIKAEALFKKRGLDKSGTFIAGDGLQPLMNTPKVDAVLISGMGGETIASILLRDLPEIRVPELILSPHTEAFLVRRALYECGYHIESERVIESKRRFYLIIQALIGTEPMPDEAELLEGTAVKYSSPDVYRRYCARKQKTMEKIPCEYRANAQIK